jgi:hypothetical protein
MLKLFLGILTAWVQKLFLSAKEEKEHDWACVCKLSAFLISFTHFQSPFDWPTFSRLCKRLLFTFLFATHTILHHYVITFSPMDKSLSFFNSKKDLWKLIWLCSWLRQPQRLNSGSGQTIKFILEHLWFFATFIMFLAVKLMCSAPSSLRGF